jgi:hypothetical protein
MTDKPNEGCEPCGESASKFKIKMDPEKIKQVIGKVRKGVFDAIASVLPKEFCQHAGTMKKECLMALRSLIDDEIKRTDENMAEVRKAHDKREKKQD